MSANADQQTLTVDVQEALVLRGALNVIRELATAPGLEPNVAVPINSGRDDLFRRLTDRYRKKIEQTEETGGATLTEPLTAAEAQAIRDAAGVLSTLLQDPAGREQLVEIGWLRHPDQDVDQGEIRTLDEIADRLDPTGVRPGVTEDVDEHDVFPGIIEPNVDLEGNIVQVSEQISNVAVEWPGTDRAFAMLEGAVDRGSTCQDAFIALAGITALAVAGQGRMDHDQRLAGELPAHVDAAYTDAMSIVESEHCVGDNAQDTLWTRIDEVTNRLTPGTSRPNVRNAAHQLLNDLRSVSEAAEDFSLDEAIGEGDDERLLGHIDGLRADLENKIGPMTHAITNEADLEEEIIKIRPNSRAGCSEYLVSFAELAVIAGQVAIARDRVDGSTFSDLQSTIDAERRALLDRMGLDNVIVDEPLPTVQRDCASTESLQEIGGSFASILNPVESDPDDVETRTFAALSDIRQLFLDPRRGP